LGYEDEEDEETYVAVEELVVDVCGVCGILHIPKDLADEEIARVCRWIGEHHPGSKTDGDGKVIICAEGYDTMIFITMTEFPQFFSSHKLAMVWRN